MMPSLTISRAVHTLQDFKCFQPVWSIMERITTHKNLKMQAAEKDGSLLLQLSVVLLASYLLSFWSPALSRNARIQKMIKIQNKMLQNKGKLPHKILKSKIHNLTEISYSLYWLITSKPTLSEKRNQSQTSYLFNLNWSLLRYYFLLFFIWYFLILMILYTIWNNRNSK